MGDSDSVEIPPPVNWPSKPKSLNRQKQVCVDLSDNSSDGTRNYASGSDVKATGESNKEFKYSKGTFNEEDLIYVDDDLMDPTGLDVSMPWVTDADGNIMNSFAASTSTQSTGLDVSMPWVTDADGNIMDSFAATTSTQSASRPQADLTSSKAYDIHAHSDSGKKSSLPPDGHVVHNVHNQTSNGDRKPRHLHSLLNRISTAANNFLEGSMPCLRGSLDNLGPDMNTGWNPNSMGIQTNATSTGNDSGSPVPSSSMSVNENLHVNLKKLDLFKKFDTADDCSDHFYCKSNAFAKNQPPRSWAKKIQREWRILEKDLPDTIFVRVYESRMDLLRAAIIGAEGTPYHDGLFFFDVYFPRDYPNVPPEVNYHSGGLHINPNLYEGGYVCLSLLNTWDGSKKEKWMPGVSTVLQVLVSIQGLILNEEPYFNEPGFAYLRRTAGGKDYYSLDYNEKTLIKSLKTMVYSIRKPPKHFEDLVVGHFFKRAHDILAVCKAYEDGALVGSVVVRGGVANVNDKRKKNGVAGFLKALVKNMGQRDTTSQRFKNELTGFMKTLVEAFGQVGVEDCDRFLH